MPLRGESKSIKLVEGVRWECIPTHGNDGPSVSASPSPLLTLTAHTTQQLGIAYRPTCAACRPVQNNQKTMAVDIATASASSRTVARRVLHVGSQGKANGKSSQEGRGVTPRVTLGKSRSCPRCMWGSVMHKHMNRKMASVAV